MRRVTAAQSVAWRNPARSASSAERRWLRRKWRARLYRIRHLEWRRARPARSPGRANSAASCILRRNDNARRLRRGACRRPWRVWDVRASAATRPGREFALLDATSARWGRRGGACSACASRGCRGGSGRWGQWRALRIAIEQRVRRGTNPAPEPLADAEETLRSDGSPISVNPCRPRLAGGLCVSARCVPHGASIRCRARAP